MTFEPFSTLNRRAAALAIDIAVQVIPALFLGGGYLTPPPNHWQSLAGLAMIAAYLFSGYTSRGSLGKVVVGLRIVDHSGLSPTLWQPLVRGLSRDLLVLLFLVYGMINEIVSVAGGSMSIDIDSAWFSIIGVLVLLGVGAGGASLFVSVIAVVFFRRQAVHDWLASTMLVRGAEKGGGKGSGGRKRVRSQ